jgi:hypothetical protein
MAFHVGFLFPYREFVFDPLHDSPRRIECRAAVSGRHTHPDRRITNLQSSGMVPSDDLQNAIIADDITARVASTPDQPENQILAVFDWLGDWFRSQDFHGCLFIKASGEYPEKKDLPHKAAVAFKQTCLDLLSSLSAQLPVADPPALARKLALLVEGAIVLAYIHRKPDPATDAREAAQLLVSAATNR